MAADTSPRDEDDADDDADDDDDDDDNDDGGSPFPDDSNIPFEPSCCSERAVRISLLFRTGRSNLIVVSNGSFESRMRVTEGRTRGHSAFSRRVTCSF